MNGSLWVRLCLCVGVLSSPSVALSVGEMSLPGVPLVTGLIVFCPGVLGILVKLAIN